jgi:exosortase/archaeosortase family protein
LQSGDLIITNWSIFQVIETCAGFRMILTLVMAAFVYCELMNLKPARRIALTLAAPVIAIGANYVRVVALIFYPVPESRPEHSIQGIIMIVVGIVVLWISDEAIGFFSSKRKRADGKPINVPTPIQAEPTASWRIWTLAIILASAGLSSLAIEPWPKLRISHKSIHSLPREMGTWRTGQEPLVVDSQFLGSVRFSSRTWRRYSRDDHTVSLFAGINDRTQRVSGLISQKTKMLKAGSVLVRDHLAADDLKYPDVRSLIVQTKRGATLAGRHWYENTEGFWTEVFRSMFALDQSPWRRKEPSRVIMISTPFDGTTDDFKIAEDRLREFSDLVRTELQKLGAPR